MPQHDVGSRGCKVSQEKACCSCNIRKKLLPEWGATGVDNWARGNPYFLRRTSAEETKLAGGNAGRDGGPRFEALDPVVRRQAAQVPLGSMRLDALGGRQHRVRSPFPGRAGGHGGRRPSGLPQSHLLVHERTVNMTRSADVASW